MTHRNILFLSIFEIHPVRVNGGKSLYICIRNISVLKLQIWKLVFDFKWMAVVIFENKSVVIVWDFINVNCIPKDENNNTILLKLFSFFLWLMYFFFFRNSSKGINLFRKRVLKKNIEIIYPFPLQALLFLFYQLINKLRFLTFRGFFVFCK